MHVFEDAASLPDFCRSCEAHIAAVTGYTVSIREKKHSTFFSSIHAQFQREAADQVPEWLNRRGECIPAALHRLLGPLQATSVSKIQA